MHSSCTLIVAAFLGIATTHQTHGEGLPDTARFLDSLAAQRNAEMQPKPERPAPVPARHEKLLSTDRLWVCMSTTPWQPVLSSPYPGAKIIGRTQPQIAASSGWANGYAEVMFYNGKIGFIPASTVRPYHSDVNPSGTCTVAGVRLNGSPVFAYR